MPVQLKTIMGFVQTFQSEAELLRHKNALHGNAYELRDGANGRELWHKGFNSLSGVVVLIEKGQQS